MGSCVSSGAVAIMRTRASPCASVAYTSPASALPVSTYVNTWRTSFASTIFPFTRSKSFSAVSVCLPYSPAGTLPGSPSAICRTLPSASPANPCKPESRGAISTNSLRSRSRREPASISPFACSSSIGPAAAARNTSTGAPCSISRASVPDPPKLLRKPTSVCPCRYCASISPTVSVRLAATESVSVVVRAGPRHAPSASTPTDKPTNTRCAAWTTDSLRNQQPSTINQQLLLAGLAPRHLVDLAPGQQEAADPIVVARRRLERRRLRAGLLDVSQPPVRVDVLQHSRPRLRHHRPIHRAVEDSVIDPPCHAERNQPRPRQLRLVVIRRVQQSRAPQPVRPLDLRQRRGHLLQLRLVLRARRIVLRQVLQRPRQPAHHPAFAARPEHLLPVLLRPCDVRRVA